jgi:hypothetical protein
MAFIAAPGKVATAAAASGNLVLKYAQSAEYLTERSCPAPVG